MSTFIKTKLKAARECIQKKDFAKARDAAEEILSYEPEHYNANVFLGLALVELGEHDLSEQAYQRAIKTSPGQALAWQGFAKFYEQSGRWDKYVETLRKMMDIFAQNGDAIKCAETLQKYVEFRRQRGSRKEIIDALHLLLPSSPLHAALSVLPALDPTAPTATTTLPTQAAVHNSLPTLEEIVALTEKEEEEAVEREVEKRRMRLDSAGVSPEAVRKEVGLKIWEISKLPSLYGEILNHVYTSDDLRRATEAKLLRYKHRYRCALAPSGDAGALKLKIGEEVQSLIEGVVLLGISDELAWTLLIEGKDVDSVEGYGFDILRRSVKLFPDALLSLAIRGYFLYNDLPLSEEEEEDEEDVKQEDADPFDVLLEAVAGLPESILAHRMLCDIYVHEEDHQNCISAAEKGLHLVRHSEVDTGKKLTQVRKAFNISLATGLVHLFPPKHHARAIRVLDDVLSFEPDNAPCLMSRGFVKQSARIWADAAELFRKVADQLPNDINMGLVAEEEHAWCLAEEGELDVAVEELQNVLDKLEELDGYEERKARVWLRIGVCYWRLGGASREKSYRHFITSLKRSPSFAPAFTALGVYYLEFSSPPDPTRATKCFQKAFELDARETDAARRLAHSFAEEREWDLVEVVARRTIEGEGGLGGGLGDEEASAIAKHKPTNAWAWKALGVVELNQRSFPAAIQAFQVALRSDENDALSWLRLGEAYAKAGRHAAALKALNKSHELQPGDWMCMYHIGDVQRQTGLLPQAITTFTEVLEKTPNETVVLLALAETHVALGRLELETGYLGRSSASFLLAIVTSLDLVECSPGFRHLALKTIVDALFALSEFSSLVDEELALKAFGRVASLHSDKADDRIAGVVDWPLMQESGLSEGALALKLAVATCSYRLTLFAKDEDGVGSARFDLGVGLARISASSFSDKIKENAEKQAIESVRLALIAEPGNPMFWNAFGNFNFVSRPMIAQHAYIKALEINSKDVAVWANLGFLCLQNEDLGLANEAFLKAQTLDPDYTLAWVGQGLVASRNGHEDDASTLFEHAVGLTADLPEADIEYAYRMFRKLPRLASRAAGSPQEMLLPPFFALDRYCRRMPRDSSALHLFGLVCERLHLYELGVEMTTRAIKHLEAAYEEIEDPVIERRYAIANTNLGRLLLATGDFSDAVDTFETAFGLLPAEDDSAETVALRAMCQFGSGIAQFQLGSFDEALVLFESAQEIASAYPLIHGQVTVLLAQVLWAIGTDEFRESAKEQLLECINSDPENLAAVVALAAMGLLTGDEALIDAALSEILSLPLDERHRRDPERYVENLLTNHYLAEANTPKALAIAQRAVYTEPSRPEACYNLSSLLVCESRPEIAQALLSRLLESPRIYSESGLHRSLQLLAIASVASGGGWAAQAEARKIAQRAIVLAPWDSKNWLAFAHVQNTPNHQ